MAAVRFLAGIGWVQSRLRRALGSVGKGSRNERLRASCGLSMPKQDRLFGEVNDRGVALNIAMARVGLRKIHGQGERWR